MACKSGLRFAPSVAGSCHGQPGGQRRQSGSFWEGSLTAGPSAGSSLCEACWFSLEVTASEGFSAARATAVSVDCAPSSVERASPCSKALVQDFPLLGFVFSVGCAFWESAASPGFSWDFAIDALESVLRPFAPFSDPASGSSALLDDDRRRYGVSLAEGKRDQPSRAATPAVVARAMLSAALQQSDLCFGAAGDDHLRRFLRHPLVQEGQHRSQAPRQ